MNDLFFKRVRAAAIAGWWTVLILWGVLTLTWFNYLGIMSARPSWMLALCGPDVSWTELETIVLWIIAVFKLCGWLAVFAVIWLTLWSWQLRKGAGGS